MNGIRGNSRVIRDVCPAIYARLYALTFSVPNVAEEKSNPPSDGLPACVRGIRHGEHQTSNINNQWLCCFLPLNFYFFLSVLAPFPFTDLSAVKQRTALILSPKRLNNVGTDLMVAAISSQIPNAIGEDEILLSEADQRTAGLPKASIIAMKAVAEGR